MLQLDAPPVNTGALHFSGFGFEENACNPLAYNGNPPACPVQFSYIEHHHEIDLESTTGKTEIDDQAHEIDQLNTKLNDAITLELINEFVRTKAVPAGVRLNQADQLVANTHKAIDLAVEHDLLDVQFITINLRHLERRDDAIGTLERHLKPILAGRPFVYVGVHIPAPADDHELIGEIPGDDDLIEIQNQVQANGKGKRTKPQHHVHIVVFLPADSRPNPTVPPVLHLDGDRRWKWDRWMQPEIQTWREGRNARMSKSAHVQPIFDITGAVGYMDSGRNLGVEGAKPIASKAVKAKKPRVVVPDQGVQQVRVEAPQAPVDALSVATSETTPADPDRTHESPDGHDDVVMLPTDIENALRILADQAQALIRNGMDADTACALVARAHRPNLPSVFIFDGLTT